MSQRTYMKIITHIVKDSETSISTANKVYTDLDKFIKHVHGKDDADCGDDLWSSFSRTPEKDYDEITAEFSCEVTGIPEETIENIISVIDTLDNGSYGMLLADTDYGVSRYKCFGKAEFTEVTADDVKDYIWGTNDYLCIETKMPVEKLAQLLNCGAEEVCEEAEERGDELAEKLLPDFFNDMYEENKNIYPGFYTDEGAFSNLADANEKDGVATIAIYFRFLNHFTKQLLTLKKVFDDGTLKDWTLRQYDCYEKDGVYTNVMIEHKTNSVVVFTTSAGRVESIKFMTMKPLK